MKSERLLVVAGFILISVIWGSTWLAIKIGLENIPPFFGVALRFTVASIILLAITFLRGKKIPLDNRMVMLYLSLGLLSFSLPYALVYWGEQSIPSGLTSILFAFYPFVVAAVSHFFLPNEKLTAGKIIGIILGFAGLFIIFRADLHVESGKMLAMFAIIVSTLMQGVSLVIVKRMGKHIDPLTMNCGGILAGIPVMYLLAFLLEDPSAIHFGPQGIGSILYLGSFGTVLTFGVFYWLLKRVEAVYLALTSLITPILAVVLGAIWYSETLSSNVFIGASMVFAGIAAINGKELIKKMFFQQKGKAE